MEAEVISLSLQYEGDQPVVTAEIRNFGRFAKGHPSADKIQTVKFTPNWELTSVHNASGEQSLGGKTRPVTDEEIANAHDAKK